MLEKLKKDLGKLQNACLWLSGGKDSRLLLETLLSIEAKFSILRFDDGWTKQQRAAVDDLTIRHKLRVYRYQPRFGHIMGNGEGDLAVVLGYAVGSQGETVTLFRDIVDGTRCAFDVDMPMSESRTPPIHFPFHVIGTKKGESHWVLNGKPFLDASRWQVGDAKFIAPLFKWTDADVVNALRGEFGIEWEQPSDETDGGNLVACTACLHGVADVFCLKTGGSAEVVDWSPEANLAAWQQAAGI